MILNFAQQSYQQNNNDDLDDLVFAAEEEQEVLLQEPWDILIVDDDVEVHQITKLALNDFVYNHRPLNFLSAYSGREAKEILDQSSKIALVFLDVVMETEEAGLEVVRYVREVLDNQEIRIVLRTGQPGKAPENKVILNYDINDYRTKTELTSQRLLTTVVSALRAYESLKKVYDTNKSLEKALRELKESQTQLIQSEKMSSLGQLVAGIAHEINNPVNFIYGNLIHTSDYINDLMRILELYQEEYSTPSPFLQEEIEALELDYLKEDLPCMLSSMNVGAERIRQIVLSLRNFSRINEASFKMVDLHEGIDSTLLILHNRLKAKSNRPVIEVTKLYGNMPEIECYPGQLNQVFMNLLANAIDAVEDRFDQDKTCPLQIAISTQLVDGKEVMIEIKDSGLGMTEEVRKKIFEPMFTTKPIGKGTGLGLPISQHIIEDKHQGKLSCHSTLGKGTEFIVQIPRSQRHHSPGRV